MAVAVARESEQRTSTKELLALLGNRLPCTFLAWLQGKRLITWHMKRRYKKSNRMVYLVCNLSQNRIQWVPRGGRGLPLWCLRPRGSRQRKNMNPSPHHHHHLVAAPAMLHPRPGAREGTSRNFTTDPRWPRRSSHSPSSNPWLPMQQQRWQQLLWTLKMLRPGPSPRPPLPSLSSDPQWT